MGQVQRTRQLVVQPVLLETATDVHLDRLAIDQAGKNATTLLLAMLAGHRVHHGTATRQRVHLVPQAIVPTPAEMMTGQLGKTAKDLVPLDDLLVHHGTAPHPRVHLVPQGIVPTHAVTTTFRHGKTVTVPAPLDDHLVHHATEARPRVHRAQRGIAPTHAVTTTVRHGKTVTVPAPLDDHLVHHGTAPRPRVRRESQAIAPSPAVMMIDQPGKNATLRVPLDDHLVHREIEESAEHLESPTRSAPTNPCQRAGAALRVEVPEMCVRWQKELKPSVQGTPALR